MKKIFLLSLIFVCLKSFGQFPPNTSVGSDKTGYVIRGVVINDSGYQYRINYPDTLTANKGQIRLMPGIFIRVNDTLYSLSQDLTHWIKQGGGSGGGGSGSLTSLGGGIAVGITSTLNTNSLSAGYGQLISAPSSNLITFSSDTAALFPGVVSTFAAGSGINIAGRTISNIGRFGKNAEDVRATAGRSFSFAGLDNFWDSIGDTRFAMKTAPKKFLISAINSATTDSGYFLLQRIAGITPSTTVQMGLTTTATATTGLFRTKKLGSGGAITNEMSVDGGALSHVNYIVQDTGSIQIASARTFPTYKQSYVYLYPDSLLLQNGDQLPTSYLRLFYGGADQWANDSLVWRRADRNSFYKITDGFGHIYADDSLLFESESGYYRFTDLLTGTTSDKVALITSNGQLKQIAMSSIIGATPTLQQVITAGSTLTTDNTIEMGGHNLFIENSGDGIINLFGSSSSTLGGLQWFISPTNSLDITSKRIVMFGSDSIVFNSPKYTYSSTSSYQPTRLTDTTGTDIQVMTRATGQIKRIPSGVYGAGSSFALTNGNLTTVGGDGTSIDLGGISTNPGGTTLAMNTDAFTVDGTGEIILGDNSSVGNSTLLTVSDANSLIDITAAIKIRITTPAFLPRSDNVTDLGDATHQFKSIWVTGGSYKMDGVTVLSSSGLFLPTSSVINFGSSNVVMTHTSGILTMGTGTLKISNPTNTSTSVVTIDGTQTLTNKSIAIGQITGLGTGVATALAVNVGSAGAFVTFNGALGTPSSGTLTNTAGYLWNNLTAPTADQALTFAAGFSSTWTNSNTTEDLFTMNTSTLTTSSMLSINSTSTALAAGNNLAEFVMSGANGTNAITATALVATVSNTNATSGTNRAAFFTASGATTANIALQTGGGNVLIGSPTNNALDALIIQSPNNTAGNGLRIYANNNSTYAEFGYGAILNPGGFIIQSSSATVINMSGNNVFVGGSTTPTSSLHTLSFATGYVAKTANYTLTINDHTVNCTANSFTITLPTAVGISGREYIIKNTGTATTITIATTSSQTIDGAVPGTVTGLVPLRVISDGANWISW